MWDFLPTPVIIAHRGDKAYAPENTLSAFEQAAKKGADAIEFDVKLSADGQVIVLHDPTVDRTTNGSGKVSKLTLNELRSLDAGIQFPGLFPNEKIPTLEEVFTAVGKRLFMNIELSNYFTPTDSLVEKVSNLVKEHGMDNRVFFSSYLPCNLHKAHRFLPNVPQGLLTAAGYLGFLGRNFGWRNNYDALNPTMATVTANLIKRVHATGKRVITWTVNKEMDIKRMVDLNVDGIITDDPALALRVLGRSS